MSTASSEFANNTAEAMRGVHLLAMQHGIHGFAADLLPLARDLRLLYDENGHNTHDLQFIRASGSEMMKSRDGIEKCALRLVAEISDTVANIDGQTAIELTLVGHSLGGLIVRYAAKLIFELRDTAHALVSNGGRLRFHCMLALNAPHLGVRKPGGGFGKSVWRGLVHNTVGVGLFGRSGKELALADEQQLLHQVSAELHNRKRMK
jgi:hypothetical protein